MECQRDPSDSLLYNQGTDDCGRYQRSMNRSYHKKVKTSYGREEIYKSGEKSGKVKEDTPLTKCVSPQESLEITCSPEPECASPIYDCSKKVLTMDDSDYECNMSCSDTQVPAPSSYAKSIEESKEQLEPQVSRSCERDMEYFLPTSGFKSYGRHDECLSQGKDIGIVEEQSSVNDCKSEEIKPLGKNPFSEPWEESDLVLLVANEKFHVHRLVLILNSPVFKAMLKSDFTQARSKEITLPEKDPVDVLDLLLQLYPQQGEDITMENVGHILKLADEYQINSVIERCGSFLRITKKGNADAMYILVLAQKYKLSAVAEECCELLADLSLEDLETYEEFEEVDGYHLRQVLLPRMRRLEKVITDLQPEISGLLKCATWLWSQAKKPMQWCPVHYAGGIPTVSQKDGLPKCKACENVIQHLATNTIRGSHYNRNEDPTENFVPVLKELFSLSGSKNN